MLTKASVAERDNASLFSLIRQPVKRTTSNRPARRGAVLEHKGNALMQFKPSAKPAQAEPEPAEVGDLPHWAMMSPIQLFITYTDHTGSPKRHHVVPWSDSRTQDIELARAIKDIQRNGGRHLIMAVMAMKTATCVSRWRLG
jgi:hypothetical protein